MRVDPNISALSDVLVNELANGDAAHAPTSIEESVRCGWNFVVTHAGHSTISLNCEWHRLEKKYQKK